MKLLKFGTLASLLVALMLPPGARATPFTITFSTLPTNGMLTGQPGAFVGWGYQLTNSDTANWFIPTQLSASSFMLGTPDAGYFDFPMLAPDMSASANLDRASMSGLYGLQIFDFATPGQTDSGQFALSGEWWSGNPFAGGVFLQAGETSIAPFSVQVVAAVVPVPGTLALFGLGLLLLGWSCQRRREELEQRGTGLG